MRMLNDPERSDAKKKCREKYTMILLMEAISGKWECGGQGSSWGFYSLNFSSLLYSQIFK